MQHSLARQRAYFLQLFEASSQAITALDQNGRITSVNKSFENLFGYSENEIKGRNKRDITVPDDLQEEFESIGRSILAGNMVKKETYRSHRDGRRIPVSVLGFPIKVDGRYEGNFYIFEDISERKAFEKQLYQQAFYDGLTQIPNRILFMERLGRALERRKRKDDFSFAVLLIDLDRFKWVNDSLGHLAGDQLLKTIARRFTSSVRVGDTVARLGGDEFAILIEEFDKNSQVIEIAERLLGEAHLPVIIEKTEVCVSASIGIVLTTASYSKTEAILRDADIAMYRAKELGKARFQIFNRRLHQLASEALELEQNLREAINSNQLLLHYQPIISTFSRELIGLEALVRWSHPEKGLISPDKFIPIAEETGLIIPLGEWVLRTACNQLKLWQQLLPGQDRLKVNVNISARQFLRNDLTATVEETLRQAALEAGYLTVELTESAIMEGGKTAVEKLNRLKSIGVQIAIDDFGTGYSSLSALQRFPIDELKIDRSFINNVETRSENMEIVKTIITLAKNLNLEIIAEGVETKTQLHLLESMDCDNVQGFYFSKPLAAENIASFAETFEKEQKRKN